MESYLKGERSHSEFDAQIDQVYLKGQKASIDREFLKELSDEYSVDFAALYFTDVMLADTANKDLRSRLTQELLLLERL